MVPYGYDSCLSAGWKSGIHKCPRNYQHPWLVIGPNQDCYYAAWNRKEARRAWKYAKRWSDFEGFQG